MSSTSTPLPPSLEKLVQRFQRMSDPKQRYEQILWFAKRLPPFPDTAKIPENKVPGCVSQVYVIAQLDNGKVAFQGDSDALITKGLVALLIQGMNGLSPAEIAALTPEFIQDTGLSVSLTPSRANGFYNIFQTMKLKTQELAH